MIRNALFGLASLALLSCTVLAQGEKKAPEVPEAKTLIERHIEETGGKKAYLAIRNYKVKGEIVTEEGNPLSGTIDVSFARIPELDEKGKPTKKERLCYHMLLDLGEGLRVEQGSDGVTHWMVTSYDGVHIMPESEYRTLLTDLDIAAFARSKDYYSSMKTEGKVMVGKRPAWEVEVKRLQDTRREFLRFDVETGKLLGNKFITSTENGDLVTSTEIETWRKLGDLQIADKTIDRGPGYKQRTSFISGAMNVEMTLDDFKVPQAVRDHLKKPKADPEGEGES